MTARHALVSLERDGLVERRRGVETFVGTPRIQINQPMTSTEQLAGRGLTAKSKILLACIVYDAQEVAAKLALSSDSGIIKLMRLRHAAGKPLSLETCYLAAENFQDCSRLTYRFDCSQDARAHVQPDIGAC
jgi:GntR family transcriptional regulator